MIATVHRLVAMLAQRIGCADDEFDDDENADYFTMPSGRHFDEIVKDLQAACAGDGCFVPSTIDEAASKDGAKDLMAELQSSLRDIIKRCV